MTIKYLPDKILKKYAPENKIKKMIDKKFNIKKKFLSIFDGVDFLDKKKITSTVLKAASFYKNKFDDLLGEGETKAIALEETLNESALLIQRVQNTVILQISESIKEDYQGEFYRWLPSDAETPDPIHQLNYGKTFQVGEGEFPGERYGCRCGAEILTNNSNMII
jgi:hypothetical protein